jgi:leucyl aminopeptidase
MRVRLTDGDLPSQKADLGACFIFEGDRKPRGLVDRTLSRELAARIKADRFEGKKGDRLIWNVNGRGGDRRYVVIGLGKTTVPEDEAIRLGSAAAARRAADFSARSLALRLPSADGDRAVADVRAAVEGALMGAYRFDRYLTDPSRRDTHLDRLTLSATGPRARMRRAVALGESTGRAVCLARDLVNEAPSTLNPAGMARRAVAEAKKAGLKARVLNAAELKRIGLKALLSVSRGSEQKPCVVHLTYKPQGKPRGRVVLVGKGVTFDSGGMNLKPGDSMRTMKGDMAGAAAVLAAMTVLKEAGCRSEVHGLLGLVENMTGGDAYKPGDILQTYAGKTVEVGNTDAEGRLVMCDLLAWAAKKLKPQTMVDVATLTGACVVALGQQASGVFSRHDALRDALLDAGKQAGEKLWALPMYDDYLQLLQKGPADLCNVGGRWGGAITAALFLGEFVPREIPWLHLDIAGPAFAESDTSEAPEGGTGAGVRTLVRWLEAL